MSVPYCVKAKPLGYDGNRQLTVFLIACNLAPFGSIRVRIKLQTIRPAICSQATSVSHEILRSGLKRELTPWEVDLTVWKGENRGARTSKPEIERAFEAIRNEIAQKNLSGVEATLDPNFIRLALPGEDRVLSIGYVDGSGYFLTASPTSFFQLDAVANVALGLVRSERQAPGIGRVLGSKTFGSDQTAAHRAEQLASAIASEAPDPEDVKTILDEIPSTERGIDLLATVASLKRCRVALDKLRTLLLTGGTSESGYQALLGANPWMLGSQYTEVLRTEFMLWFGARVDLVLSNAIGYVEIVELKRPDMKLLVEGAHRNVWKASSELSEALAQVRVYIRALDENRTAIEQRLGVASQSISRMYRSGVIIVGGRTPGQKEARDSLRELSVSEPRLLILTYDDVLAIGEATVTLFERSLTRRPERVLPGARSLG